jgi:NitT/TauT family transport system substrate-binding protein
MATRRAFVRGAALAAGAGLLGFRPYAVAADAPPETTTIRLMHQPLACFAPLFVAEPLLLGEGFRRVDYVPVRVGPPTTGARHGFVSMALNSGEVDLGALDPPAHILSLDAGGSAVLLAGLHAGCYKLLASERIRTLRELKGKTVAVPSLGRHAFVASIVSYIGLDPRKDIVWANANAADAMQLFAEGVLDAFMGFAPEPAELLSRKAGHVLVDTLTDKPWSQYFCCILAGNREFVRKNPMATKRALRAILKANEICAADPERAVRALVERGYARGQNTALELMREIPYARWRDYDTEATVRFYALRLREAGMITSTPQKIIASSTDWRFINELKKELKG